MRYAIPPDIREKEKIIGGVLTGSQTVIIAVGAAVAFIVVNGLYNLTANVVIAVLGVAVLVPFGYVALKRMPKYGDIEYSQYLIFKHRYNKSRKEFPNINENFRK